MVGSQGLELRAIRHFLDISEKTLREWRILHFLDLSLELTTKRMLNFLVSPTAQMGRLLSRQEGRIEMKRKIVKL